MKRVLITGKGSYVGTYVANWLQRHSDEFEIEILDMLDEEWSHFDFHGFDSVYHVAGIAHADISHVSEETKQLYYKVNCDLAVQTAKIAKEAGVKQFIYMSSLLVYGDRGNGSYRNKELIGRETTPKPSNFYGDSKWQAEQKLSELACDAFQIAILRPPMIYGPGCKGNYNGLRKIAMKSPLFPKFENQRSVLFIGNLSEFVRLLILDGRGGVFWPQDPTFVRTSDFIREIANAHGKKPWITKSLNWLVPVGACFPGKIGSLVNKAFGSLAVDAALSKEFEGKYQLFTFEESIRQTEAQ
jgi:UDP-glucose 4-epimerase